MRGSSARGANSLLVATCKADDAGGVDAVVAFGPLALLFLGRGYVDPAPRARPAPRFEASRGTLGEIGPDLLVANLATSRVVDDPDAWTSGRRPCFPAEGGAGANWIPANPDRRIGRAAIVSISASDCCIDAAIHESLAIEAGDPEPRWCLARRSDRDHRSVMRLLRRPPPGREQALGPRAGSSKQQ